MFNSVTPGRKTGTKSAGLTRNSIVQNESDWATNKHGSGEEDIQHLVNLSYAWKNIERHTAALASI